MLSREASPAFAPAASRKREPIVWADLLPSIALLCGCLALFSLAIAWSLWLGNAEAFFGKNQLARFQRVKMLNMMAVVAAVPGALAMLTALVLGGRGARAVERLARVVAPLALVSAVYVLGVYSYWHSHPLEFLLLLAISVLAFEQALRQSLPALPANPLLRAGELYDRLPALLRRALPWLVVLAGSCFYAAYTGYYSVLQHQRLATASFDLGIYDNLMANALAGYPFHSPVLFGSAGGNYIAGHAEYVMLLFVPIYALAPRAETLLILQSVLMGFAAVPLYAFAKTQLPRWSAALVSLAYLLYAPLHGPNFYDFHWLPISIFFVFCLFWAIATRRNVLTWLFFWVLVSTREDIPVDLALLGIFLVITNRRVLLGVCMTLLAAASFVYIKFVVMPAAGNWWFENIYKELIPPGESGYRPVVETALVNPSFFLQSLFEEAKLVYALHLFAPLAFLPARHWKLLLGASGGFFFTLMTTKYSYTLSIAFQYTSHWIPYLFGACVLALAWLGRADSGVVKRRAALMAMVLGVTLHSLVFGAILQRSNFVGGFSKIPFAITPAERARYSDLRQLVAMIPPEASVAATDSATPHISNRVMAFALREDHGDADYILIRKQLMDFLKTRKNVRAALEGHRYGLLAQRGDFYLLKRGHDSPNTEAALRALGLQDVKMP